MAKVKTLLTQQQITYFVSQGLKNLLGKPAEQPFVDKLVAVFGEHDSVNLIGSEKMVEDELRKLIKDDILKLTNAKDTTEIKRILLESRFLKDLDDSNDTIANAIHANNQAKIKKLANDQFNELIKITDYKTLLEKKKGAVLRKLPLGKMSLAFRKAELESNDFTKVNKALEKFGIVIDGEIAFETFKNSLKEHKEISTIINNDPVFETTIKTSVPTNNNSNSPDYPKNVQTIINALKSPKEQTIKDSLATAFSIKNVTISNELIAENRYFYLIKKASDGHPHLKNLLKNTPAIQAQLKDSNLDIDNVFTQLISDKPEQILQTLALQVQSQQLTDLSEDYKKNAKLCKDETTLVEIEQLFKDLNKDNINNENAKDQYLLNQITYIQNELELSSTLNAILQDQVKIEALKKFIIDNNKTPDQIKEIVLKLQSTDDNLIADVLGQNGFKLIPDPATLKTTSEKISKENLAFEQHEKITSKISQINDLMQDATIQKDFLDALKGKSDADVDQFIKTVKSNDTPIDIIHQQLLSYKLASQNDKSKATEIYKDNQFNYLLQQTPVSSNLHKEFIAKDQEIKPTIAALSPQQIQDAFKVVKQAVNEKSIEDGLKVLGIKSPSQNLLKENVDLFAKERTQAFKRNQQLENQEKEITTQQLETNNELDKQKSLPNQGDQIVIQKIQDLEKQAANLKQQLDTLSPQITTAKINLKTAQDEEDAFLKKKFIDEQFTQPAVAKAAADQKITVKGAQDDAENTHFYSLNEYKKGDRAANRFDKTLLLAKRYCLGAEKTALSNARHFNRSNDLTDGKTDLQENIAGCKRVKAELLWYVEKLKKDNPKFAKERIQKSEKYIAQLNETINAYEPAINQPLDKLVHFSTKSEVFTDMTLRDQKIQQLLGTSGQAAPVDNGTLTTDNNLASHFNTSPKFGNGARLNCLETNVGGKIVNLLDNQQVVDGVFKTTAYFKLEDFQKCSRDQKLRYAITLIENHWAGDPSPHGKFKASENFPPELIELMAIYCKREHIKFIAPPQKPQSGLSKIFNQRPSKPTDKQVEEMDKKINENPAHFYGSKQLSALKHRHEAIKLMQQETGQTNIQSFTSARIG